MKLILSRKGFDSSYGGCASPIFPDSALYSLPIPDCYSNITYGDIRHGDTNIGEMVEDLTDKDVKRDHYAHLDPDINLRSLSTRQEGLATSVWPIVSQPKVIYDNEVCSNRRSVPVFRILPES